MFMHLTIKKASDGSFEVDDVSSYNQGFVTIENARKAAQEQQEEYGSESSGLIFVVVEVLEQYVTNPSFVPFSA